jgi:hypothetical protein
MSKTSKILTEMRESPHDVRFADLRRVCSEYFGAPRQQGTSHAVYRMPWAGDPRINIQRGPGGRAKRYQVIQALAAIDRLVGEREDTDR